MFRYFYQFLIASLVLLSLLIPFSVKAGSGLERLDNFFEGLGSLRANFEQTVIDATAFSLEKSGGVLIMQRPDKFLWDYQRPYQQAIIADGKKIYIYDAD